MKSVTRYVVTHVGTDGRRVMANAAQGRHTYATREEGERMADLMRKNNRIEGGKLAGVFGLPLQVRACPCYPGHFDPQRVYFPAAPRFSVVLIQPDGGRVYLSHRGRSEWAKRTALRHLADVRADSRFTSFYVDFQIEEV